MPLGGCGPRLRGRVTAIGQLLITQHQLGSANSHVPSLLSAQEEAFRIAWKTCLKREVWGGKLATPHPSVPVQADQAYLWPALPQQIIGWL